MQDIHDIVETSTQVDLLLWWQWALIVVGVLLLFTGLFYLIKRQSKHASARKQTPAEMALNQLQKLNVHDTTSNQLAVHLSLIVRQFLQRRHNDHALFQTDEELHARSADFEKLSAESSQQLQSYLAAVSEHKYAPNANHPAALESLIEKASYLIKELDKHSQSSTLR